MITNIKMLAVYNNGKTIFTSEFTDFASKVSLHNFLKSNGFKVESIKFI